MIILERKKIVFTIGIITAFVFTYIVSGYNIKSNRKINNEENTNTVETVALPVNNKVIIIDARTSEFQMNGAESSMRNNRS